MKVKKNVLVREKTKIKKSKQTNKKQNKTKKTHPYPNFLTPPWKFNDASLRCFSMLKWANTDHLLILVNSKASLVNSKISSPKSNCA